MGNQMLSWLLKITIVICSDLLLQVLWTCYIDDLSFSLMIGYYQQIISVMLPLYYYFWINHSVLNFGDTKVHNAC